MNFLNINYIKKYFFHFHNKFKQSGFSLAEVTFILLIVGIIAAMTIPTIITRYKANEMETRFRKAQSVLNNSINYMKFETGEDLTIENFSSRNFKDVFKKYYNVIEDCNWRDCFDNAIPKYRNYSNTTDLYYEYFDDGNFVISDGMTFFIEDYNYLMISVDLNGYKKKPNRYGHDLFTFMFVSDDKDNGHFVANGNKSSGFSADNYCSKSSSHRINGIGCAYHVLEDAKYFEKLH